ncbi:hypothetical protein ScPMuIL_002929 [Solemya velum]
MLNVNAQGMAALASLMGRSGGAAGLGAGAMGAAGLGAAGAGAGASAGAADGTMGKLDFRLSNFYSIHRSEFE